MRLPTTTYRLQLREGVTFETVEGLLPYLVDLGISDLYLSPIFRASTGSTHGYDVIDPNEIEPSLGGRAGFESLAKAAQDHGLGVILDIVPNHTAFSPENPWLRDVLRHGRDSRYAAHFDIDWSEGRLLLPMLQAPFEARLAEGAFEIREAEDGPVLCDGPLEIPLRPASVPKETPDTDRLRQLHEAQAWKLCDWRLERDSVTHRRFFNITGLIGMRIEDEGVFEDMHRTTFELADAGLIQGLRLDHVDGLADPGRYLRRLRDRLGDMPIWIEKILTGDEALPDWPVQGTTGYEAARSIARVLTDEDGLARLDAEWREATGSRSDFARTLAQSKAEVLRNELAAELHQLIHLAQKAAKAARGIEVGPEFLREAIEALLIAFPRYRTYFDSGEPRPEDLELWDAVVAEAARRPRSDAAITFVAGLVREPDTEEAAAFRTRFQQVTGALIAKAHEDTASFRYTRFLAANEVGAEPDHATLDVGGFAWILERRQNMQPQGLTLTSSHDTKRSEDARMRLVAISHMPEAFEKLYQDASIRVPGAADVGPNFRWYLCQSLLAIWDDAADDLGQRLADHAEKAMREAKRITYWTDPVEEVEAPALDWAQSLAADWGRYLPRAAEELIERGRVLSEVQVALKFVMPGIPDIYQGAEIGHHYLTDPDNRRPVDFAHLARVAGEDGFDGRKARLTRALARLRRDAGDFFTQAAPEFDRIGEGRFTLRRAAGGKSLCLTFDTTGPLQAGKADIWPSKQDAEVSPVRLHWD